MTILPSVLIIDDEEELDSLYKIFFEEYGFNTVSFTEPLDAAEHFGLNHDEYSVVIIDLRKAGHDAINITRLIRKLDKNVKIILIRGNINDQNYQTKQLQDYNITAIYEIPISFTNLVTNVKEILDGKTAQKADLVEVARKTFRK